MVLLATQPDRRARGIVGNGAGERRELELISYAWSERGHRAHIYRERRSSGRERRAAYMESLPAAVRRRFVDCRQANPPQRQAIHCGRRASQVVHLDRKSVVWGK